MFSNPRYPSTILRVALLVAILMFPAGLMARTRFRLFIVDNVGVGFNDPTPATPVGGNNGTTRGEQREIALRRALEIIGENLDSSVEIAVNASFPNLPCSATTGVLGSARTNDIFANFPNANQRNVFYHAALANKIEGSDLTPLSIPSNADIVSFFNRAVDEDSTCLGGNGWYYGLDHNEGSSPDFLAVVLHELSHGLGFSNLTNEETGVLSAGLPSIFDTFIFDVTTGKTWDQMNDAERMASAVNDPNVVWNGPAADKAAKAILNHPLVFSINSPPAIAGSRSAIGAAFGPPVPEAGLTGDIVPVEDGTAITSDGCEALTNGDAVAGKIALIDRGNCTFVQKVRNAQMAGAIGVVIANNVPGIITAGGSDPTIAIPVIMVETTTGDAIKANQPVNATLDFDRDRLQGAQDQKIRLHAPSPVESGSSISHWTSDVSPNLLMEPFISNDLTDNLDLTIPLFEDIGWCDDFQVAAAPPDYAITVTGSPGCLFDLYDTRSSDDPGDWELVGAGTIAPDRSGPALDAAMRPVTASRDVAYIATATGQPALARSGVFSVSTTFLYFPRVVNLPGERTGIAIANLSTVAANLTFRAKEPGGNLITGTDIINPAVRRLEGSAQLAELAFQIFGTGFINSSAWVEVESDNPRIVGFYLFLDDAVNFLDGADAVGQTRKQMIFTETESMELSLANPNTARADVSLRLLTDAGQLMSQRDDVRIAPMGRFSSDLSVLFPTLTQEAFDGVQQTGNTHLLVDSTEGLVGLSLIGNKPRFIAGLTGQATQGATQLFVPQYVEGGGFTTAMSIVNLDAAAAARVSLALIGEDGAQMGVTAQISIPPWGKAAIKDPGVFGLSAGEGVIEGYIVVTSDGAQLAGSVIFGDTNRTEFEAALPFVSQPQREVVYSQVAQDNMFFTGAAVINLSDSKLTVTIDVFDTAGNLIRTGTREVAARGRDSFVLTEPFPDLNISSGYFRLRSDQDMASFALFGNGNALSAVPPQTAP